MGSGDGFREPLRRLGMPTLGSGRNTDGCSCTFPGVQTLPGAPWAQPHGGAAVGAEPCAPGMSPATGGGKSWPLPSSNPSRFSPEGQLLAAVPGAVHPGEGLGWDLDTPALWVWGHRGKGRVFFNLVSRAAGVAGQGDAFPLAETNRQSQTLWHPGCCFGTQTW